MTSYADEDVAVAAGYRPCAHYLPLEYREWQLARSDLSCT